MNNLLYITIFSLVQGITEFLPVSSSGHLVVLHSFFPDAVANNLSFDVVLHLASVLAVVVFFWPEIKKIIVSWLKSLISASQLDSDAKLGWLIIIATIPAGLAGYFFEDFIKNQLRSNLVVAIMLIIVGLLLLMIEKFAKQQDDVKNLTWKKSLLIGVAQAVALIPGTSRSGITIIAGMAANLKREAAVRFSFILSIPVIIGANIKEIPTVAAISKDELFSFIFGFVMTWVVSYLVIKYFMAMAKKYPLNIFAYYRFILAGIIIFFLLI